MSKFIKILLLLAGFFSCQAQTIQIKGMVKDSIQLPLAYANVFAAPQEEDINIAYAITNAQGKYELNLIKNKQYTITTSSLGFLPKTTVFQFTKDTVYNFTLQEKTNYLDIIEIEYTIPIIVKKDTLTYNATSFTTGNERKLKDILKKLPGVEVDRKGNVLANGKKVTKLLIENKPFFGGNTKLGVNNIPADAIDKIQVLENYNKISMLQSHTNNNKAILNIKLKAEKKKFVFGDIETAIGVEKKYLIHPKLFYYSPKTSVNLIGDVTNTGKKSFTMEDYALFEKVSVSDFEKHISLYNSDFSKYLSNDNYKSDRMLFGAFSIRQSVNKFTDISTYVISNKSSTITENYTTNKYIFDVPFTENRRSIKKIDNLYSLGKFTIEYNPNRKRHYIFETKVNVSDSKSSNLISTISPDINNNIKNDSSLDAFSFTQNVSLNNKLSDKHIVTLDANYTLKKDIPNSQWITNQKLLENLAPIITQDYYQIEQNKRVKVHAINALLKDYWKIHRNHKMFTSIGLQTKNSNFYTKDWQLLENGSINNFGAANFNNDFNYNFRDFYMGVEYKYKFRKTVIQPSIYAHTYYWNMKQINQNELSRNKNLLLPKIYVSVNFNKSESLDLSYKLKANFPNANILANRFVLSNFNTVYKGNSNLNNTLYHSFYVNFYKSKSYKGYFLSLNSSYFKQIRDFKNVSELEGINQYYTKIMFAEPEINWSIGGSFSRIKNNVRGRIKSHYYYAEYTQLVNNTQNLNQSNRISVSPSIKTLFKNFPNIEIGYTTSFITYKNTITTNYTNEELFTYLDYDYKDFIFEADFSYKSYKNDVENSINNTFINANASIYYQKETTPWGFELKTSNLFNTQYKQSNNLNDFIISDSKTYILPRVVMLKIIYKL